MQDVSDCTLGSKSSDIRSLTYSYKEGYPEKIERAQRPGKTLASTGFNRSDIW